MMARLKQYALLMRCHKPIGILLLLWPTLWGLWLASEGTPNIRLLWVFIAGVVLMRSAGCVMNDWADRDIDRHVARTRDRPLAAGRVAPKEALILFVVLCLASFGLVLLTNPLTITLSFVGAGLALSYPFFKRFTHLPQFYLGAAFGWGIVLAFASVRESLPVLAWILFTANIFWAVAYDTEYAMVDRKDDVKIGVKSTAILFGRYDRALIAVFHALALLLLLFAGGLAQLGVVYDIGLGLAGLSAGYQQYLIRYRRPESCLRAFMNNGWFGAAVFGGLAFDYFTRTP